MASTSVQALPPIPPDIAAFAGPPLIGIMLNWFLYGILVMQLYVYYQWFPYDKKLIKCLVYGLFFIDSLQSCLATADAFHWFARGFGNMITLAQPFISAFDAPILDGIMAFAVQSFFCWRIWVLQRSWWLPLSIFGVALISVAGAIATGVGGYQIPNLTQLIDLKWQLCLWLGGSAVADTLIAIVMTYLLLRSRTRDHEKTDNILVKIVRLTVETNTVTASVAIIVLVCLLAIPDNSSIAMTPSYALGKLYSNTLLAIFNNRIYMNSRSGYPRSHGSSNGTDVHFRYPIAQRPQETSNAQANVQVEPVLLELHRNADSKFPTNVQLQVPVHPEMNEEGTYTKQDV